MSVFSFFLDVVNVCNASAKKNSNAFIVKESTKNAKKYSKSILNELSTSFEFMTNFELKILFNKRSLESKSN